MMWELWGVLVSGAVGVLGYLGKKYVDLRVSRAVSGELEVVRKAQVEKFELIVVLGGMLAEIGHCINHLRDGDGDYGPTCTEMSLKLRRRARAGILLIGEDAVAHVMEASDIALRYATRPSPRLYEDWEKVLPHVMDRLNASLKEVGYTSSEGASAGEPKFRPTRSLKRTPDGAA